MFPPRYIKQYITKALLIYHLYEQKCEKELLGFISGEKALETSGTLFCVLSHTAFRVRVTALSACMMSTVKILKKYIRKIQRKQIRINTSAVQ
jgi:hypothetical protein